MASSPATDFENSFGLRLALRQVQRTLDFAGRSTRTEVISYWVFALLAEVALSAIMMFGWNVVAWNSPLVFTSMAIVFGVPWPALLVRRLHDQNRSGWWATVGLPYALLAWFGGPRAERPQWEHLILAALSIAILALLFWTPTDGANRYGPDPRLDPEDAVRANEPA